MSANFPVVFQHVTLQPLRSDLYAALYFGRFPPLPLSKDWSLGFSPTHTAAQSVSGDTF